MAWIWANTTKKVRYCLLGESRVWSKSRAEGVEPVSEHEQNYIGTMSTEYHHYLFCTTSHFTCIDACLDRRGLRTASARRRSLARATRTCRIPRFVSACRPTCRVATGPALAGKTHSGVAVAEGACLRWLSKSRKTSRTSTFARTRTTHTPRCSSARWWARPSWPCRTSTPFVW